MRVVFLCRSVVTIGASITCGFSHAQAESPATLQPHTALSWVRLAGADSCISAQALARAVEGRLGHVAFVSPATAATSIEGQVAPSPESGFDATLVVRNAQGTVEGRRQLHSGDANCDTHASDGEVSSVTITFGDDFASGVTDRGYEFTARRR